MSDLCASWTLSYVLLGINSTIVARTLLSGNQTLCPSVQLNDGTLVPGFLHAVPSPPEFPGTVCDAHLPDGYTSATVCGKSLATVPAAPKNYVLIGDTGRRFKVGNVQHFGFSLDPADNEWPYSQLAAAAHSVDPDVVIHVGDYTYTEGNCSDVCVQQGTGQARPCSCAIHGQHFGDTWDNWDKEFFVPSADLLTKHPWVALRGNHEKCSRQWQGFFRFLYPGALPADCPAVSPSYAVEFENEVLLVTDTGSVHEPYGGIDQFDMQCPTNTSMRAIKPLRENDSAELQSQESAEIARYTRDFSHAASLMVPSKSNFLLTHCPVFSVVCREGNYYYYLYILEQAILASTMLDTTNPLSGFPSLRLIMSGHVHWFQYIAFHYPEIALPSQIVFGHGGTKLHHGPSINASKIITEDLSVSGHRISVAENYKEFGFVVMTPSASSRGGTGAYMLSARDGNGQHAFEAPVAMSGGVGPSESTDAATTAEIDMSGRTRPSVSSDAATTILTAVAACVVAIIAFVANL